MRNKRFNYGLSGPVASGVAVNIQQT